MRVIKSKLLLFTITALIFTGVGVYADNLITADKIIYNDSTVDDALNELYNNTAKISAIEEVMSNNVYANYATVNNNTMGTLRYGSGATYSGGTINLNSAGATQFGPYISLSAGCYLVVIKGENLDKNINISATANAGSINFGVEPIQFNKYAYFYLKLNTSYSNIEFKTQATDSGYNTKIKSITIYTSNNCSS